MREYSEKLYILAGPTASGKTRVSLPLAIFLDAEIICVDSMTIYKGMNIGTAKISPQETKSIPHHMIDICEPWEEFSVQKFVDLCNQKIKEIWERKKNVLLVVGTPLYLKALLFGIFDGPKADWELRKKLEKETNENLYKELQTCDSCAAKKIALNDKNRIIRALEVFYLTGNPISKLQKEKTSPQKQYHYSICCLNWEREILYSRINQRVEQMFKEGLLEETQGLLALPKPLSKTASKAIGYKDVINFINNLLPENELIETIKRNTRRYAKRQMTWWRNFELNWIPLNDASPNWEQICCNILAIFDEDRQK